MSVLRLRPTHRRGGGQRGPSLARAVTGGVTDVRLAARGWRWARRPLVPASASGSTVVAPRGPFPTGWARTPALSAVRDAIQAGALVPLLAHQTDTTVHGRDVITRLRELGDGPIIFVANHSSHLDTGLLLAALPYAERRRTLVAAAADYFFDTWWRASGSALVFGTFPLERRASTVSATPGDLLRDGWNVVLFPEGTRSPDGWTQRFHLGAAHLSVTENVPVVPLGIRGSFAAMPRGRRWPTGNPTVTVRFGPPLWPGPGDSARTLGPQVERAVAALVDEDSTDWYSAARRAAAGTTPSTAAPVVPEGVPPAARWRRVWERTQAPAVRRPRKVWRG